LISENEEDLIQTIRSRCQILHFNGLSEPIITEALVAREDQSKHSGKNRTSSTGNYNVALSLLHANDEEHPLNNGL
jgi:DNA polymerase-3 subunit delta'